MSALAALSAGLIIVNAWYGKFVNDKSRRNEKVKVIDVTVPLQCLVKDSKLILTEASKVQTGSTTEGRLGSSSMCPGQSGLQWTLKSTWKVSPELPDATQQQCLSSWHLHVICLHIPERGCGLTWT